MSEIQPAGGRHVDPDAQIFPMSVVAQMSGVHPQTLRVYERAGLLVPHRTSGNIRLYSLDDILRARRIHALTTVEKVNLAGAQRVVELQDEIRVVLVQLVRIAYRLRELDESLTEELRDLGRDVWNTIDPGPREDERRELAAQALAASAGHPHARAARELHVLPELPAPR